MYGVSKNPEVSLLIRDAADAPLLNQNFKKSVRSHNLPSLQIYKDLWFFWDEL